MRSAFLEDADPGAVSHAVRHVLEKRGALVREHVSTRVRFTSKPPGGGWSWTRSGYVGIYQATGERDVEVRLVLRARWPHRVFWGTAAVVLALSLLTAILNPPGTTWFFVAFLGGFALLVSTLLYMNTWRPVREEERALLEALEAEFREAHVGAAVERDEERQLHALEAELEGEVEQRRSDHDTKVARADERAAKANAPKTPRALPRFKLRK